MMYFMTESRRGAKCGLRHFLSDRLEGFKCLFEECFHILFTGGAYMFTYKMRGTCAKQLQLEITNGIITACSFVGGCSGNSQGLARMVIGQNAIEVAGRLANIACQGNTSCPDQLSKAILAYLEASQKG
jgi:uncharacterized protein (TIGR03905 family)